MVFLNYTAMQMTAKIVYYGPGLCGKTTNLHWIHSKTAPRSRGEMVSLETEADRTLFFDLLPLDVGVIGGMRVRLQLYTVPGQVFYNATRRLVLKGVDGVVFVADSQVPAAEPNEESLANLRQNLEELGIDPKSVPIVFQFNKRDLRNILPIEKLAAAAQSRRSPRLRGGSRPRRRRVRDAQGDLAAVAQRDPHPITEQKKGGVAGVERRAPPDARQARERERQGRGFGERARRHPAAAPRLGRRDSRRNRPGADGSSAGRVRRGGHGQAEAARGQDARQARHRPGAREAARDHQDAKPRARPRSRIARSTSCSRSWCRARATRDQEVSRKVALEVPEHLLRGLTDLRIHLGFDRDGREEVQRDAVRVTLVRTRKLQRLRLLLDLELKTKE